MLFASKNLIQLPVHYISPGKRLQGRGSKAELQVRIGKAWENLIELTGILCDKKVTKILTVFLYKRVICPPGVIVKS